MTGKNHSRRVTGLFIYPVKSCRGLAVRAVSVDEDGPEHDRSYMIVDATGKMITQREAPQLAQIVPEIAEGGLWLHTERAKSGLFVSTVQALRAPEIETRVWSSEVLARDAGGEEAQAWFRENLGLSHARLVWLPPGSPRRTKRGGVQTRFADGYPFLFVSEESLADLNGRIEGRPVAIERFRPNVVVAGCDLPFEEDTWASFRIGSLDLEGVKLCARCKITTQDPRSGASFGKEPLKTLGKYRRHADESGVMFGVNVIHRGTGMIALGDRINLVHQAPIAP